MFLLSSWAAWNLHERAGRATNYTRARQHVNVSRRFHSGEAPAHDFSCFSDRKGHFALHQNAFRERGARAVSAYLTIRPEGYEDAVPFSVSI